MSYRSPRVALCLHDVRLSRGAFSLSLVRRVLERFGHPLTVHLVMDSDSDKGGLLDFLTKGQKENEIEIVFHGASHLLSNPRWPFLSFYHKGQAEFLDPSPAVGDIASARFALLARRIGRNPGVCFPCWLALGSYQKHFARIGASYIEGMFMLHGPGVTRLTGLASMGTEKRWEEILLKAVNTITLGMALLSGIERYRVAVHVSDLERPGALGYLEWVFRFLLGRGWKTVLQEQLLD